MFLQLKSQSTAGTPVKIEIPTTDNGAQYKALISVLNTAETPNNGGGTLPSTASVSTLPITIVGTSEQTARGVRRVLVKVELPYASLQKCSCESAQYSVDTAKSGDPITMHCVLTLPKQAGTDLQGNGAVREAVLNRIALLQYLMESLIRNTGNVISDPDNVEATVLPEEVTGASVQVGSSTYSNGSGIVGVFADNSTVLDLNSPFVRGASLLKPFVTDGTYGYGVTK